MRQKKREHPEVKAKIHPRNKHRHRYDFKALIASCPELKRYVAPNDYDDESIDFANPEAVKTLNRALLKHFYDVDFWDIPPGYLCPPIPGRADYIHHIADLLAGSNEGTIPTGSKIRCLDIGVGANCVYPLIGHKEYGWSFVGSDVDPVSVKSANMNVESNGTLKKSVEIRLQPDPNQIFRGIVRFGEIFDLAICNPPFHTSLADASTGTLRKLSNLNNKKITKPTLNFGGQNRELWCEGGEGQFAVNMISESAEFRNAFLWFSTALSKKENLKRIYKALRKVEAFEVRTIPMGQGNKVGRIVAWTFLTPEQHAEWALLRWRS